MANKRINDLPNEATPASTDRFAIDGATTRSSQLGAALAAIVAGDDATARDELGLEIGADVQAYDTMLAALVALASNGLIARTGAGTVAARTVTGTTGRVSVTNGSGAAGDPTIDWDGVQVRKNSAGSTFTRRRVNLIEGTNVTLTVADDAGSDEVDVTITASGSSPGAVLYNSVQSLTTGETAQARSNISAQPLSQSAVGVGRIESISSTSGGNLVLPSGGTWEWFCGRYQSSTGIWAGAMECGIAAGGSTVGTTTAGVVQTGRAKRIA